MLFAERGNDMGLFKKPKTHFTDNGVFLEFGDFPILEEKDFQEMWRLLGVMVRGHYIQEKESKQPQEQTPPVDGKQPQGVRRGAKR